MSAISSDDVKIPGAEAIGIMNMAADGLKTLFEKFAVCPSHGIEHAVRVMNHAALAVKSLERRRRLLGQPRIPDVEKLAVILAALLHDADDRKFFPKHHNFENARAILGRCCMLFDLVALTVEMRPYFAALETRTIAMISYVSASKNRDEVPAEAAERPWVLFARYSDRLEAVGAIGVVRCWEYTLGVKRPLFTPDTPRPKTIEELWKVATGERFQKYDGTSPSMLTHYFDKLLWMSKSFKTGNEYLDDVALRRRDDMPALALHYAHFGELPGELLEMARNKSTIEDAYLARAYAG